jgi:2-haloacid dehalogenase
MLQEHRSMSKSSNGRPAVVFDFGGVLVDWDPFYLYAGYFDNNRSAMQAFLQEVGFIEWNQKQDEGRSFKQAVEELCARFPQHCHLIRAYDQDWAKSISGLIEPVVAILKELDRQGVDLYALSNWSAEKFALVRPRYDFFNLFREIVISGQVKMLKRSLNICWVRSAARQRNASWSMIPSKISQRHAGLVFKPSITTGQISFGMNWRHSVCSQKWIGIKRHPPIVCQVR